MESDEPAVLRDGGEGISEAEAVREHDVDGLLSEFLFVELLAEEDVAYVRLHGRDVVVVGIPAAGRVPPALGDILLHLLEGFRVVLFEPVVLHGAFKAELVVRVGFQQAEILVEGVGEEFPDDLLDGPEPLGVQMGVCREVDGPFRFLGRQGESGEGRSRSEQELLHLLVFVKLFYVDTVQ